MSFQWTNLTAYNAVKFTRALARPLEDPKKPLAESGLFIGVRGPIKIKGHKTFDLLF